MWSVKFVLNGVDLSLHIKCLVKKNILLPTQACKYGLYPNGHCPHLYPTELFPCSEADRSVQVCPLKHGLKAQASISMSQ